MSKNQFNSISYYVVRPSAGNIDTNKGSSFCFSFNEPKLSNLSRIEKVNIDVASLDSEFQSKNFKKKWFVNLTSENISDTICDLLSLGEKFSLLSQNIKKTHSYGNH